MGGVRAGTGARRFETALCLGRMKALRKDNGKVRGVVAGSGLRLASKAVVMQYGEELTAATAPFQYALQTCSGAESGTLVASADWSAGRLRAPCQSHRV